MVDTINSINSIVKLYLTENKLEEYFKNILLDIQSKLLPQCEPVNHLVEIEPAGRDSEIPIHKIGKIS